MATLCEMSTSCRWFLVQLWRMVQMDYDFHLLFVHGLCWLNFISPFFCVLSFILDDVWHCAQQQASDILYLSTHVPSYKAYEIDSSVNSKLTIGVLFLSLNPICRDYLPSRYFCYWYVHALYWFDVIPCHVGNSLSSMLSQWSMIVRSIFLGSLRKMRYQLLDQITVGAGQWTCGTTTLKQTTFFNAFQYFERGLIRFNMT
jgi:hypothetical protein